MKMLNIFKLKCNESTIIFSVNLLRSLLKIHFLWASCNPQNDILTKVIKTLEIKK